MKPFFVFALILSLLSVSCASEEATDVPVETAETPQEPAPDTTAKQTMTFGDFHDGDVIFHVSQSAQSEAIKLATGSKYTHCGIVYIHRQSGKAMVFEAGELVQNVPLEKWIERGKDGHYVLKRHANSDELFDDRNIKHLAGLLREHRGKQYDLTFEWSNEKFYCSELVWKIYNDGLGIELAPLERLGDFDLTSEIVQNIMQTRYGDNPPLDEQVISPKALFESPLLSTVYEN